MPTQSISTNVGPKTEAATLKNLPGHIIAAHLNEGVTPALVKILPKHIKTVIFGSGMTPEVIEQLPEHIKSIWLCKGVKPSAVEKIPQHMTSVCTDPDIKPDILKALRLNIKKLILHPRATTMLAQAIPCHIKSVYLHWSQDQLKTLQALPQHLKYIVITPGISEREIQVLPKSATLIAKGKLSNKIQAAILQHNRRQKAEKRRRPFEEKKPSLFANLCLAAEAARAEEKAKRQKTHATDTSQSITYIPKPV